MAALSVHEQRKQAILSGKSTWKPQGITSANQNNHAQVPTEDPGRVRILMLTATPIEKDDNLPLLLHMLDILPSYQKATCTHYMKRRHANSLESLHHALFVDEHTRVASRMSKDDARVEAAVQAAKQGNNQNGDVLC